MVLEAADDPIVFAKTSVSLRPCGVCQPAGRSMSRASRAGLRETLPTSECTGREQVLLGHAAALRGPRGPHSHRGSPTDSSVNPINEFGLRVECLCLYAGPVFSLVLPVLA